VAKRQVPTQRNPPPLPRLTPAQRDAGGGRLSSEGGWQAHEHDSQRYGMSLAHCSSMLAARITLPHFSVSSPINLPKSAGVVGIGVPPKSSIRAFIFGSTRALLVSLLSFSTMSAGVFLGAPMPHQPLPS